MRSVILLSLTVALLASCAPSASPEASSWNYYDNEPGGIQVSDQGAYEDALGEQTPGEACASLGAAAFPPGYCEGLAGGSNGGSSPNGEGCEGDAAFELFPPGPAWIARCK